MRDVNHDDDTCGVPRSAQRLERVRLRIGAELRRPNVALREALQASE